MKKFEYKGYEFTAYRNFTDAEDFWQYAHGPFDGIKNFNHKEFYAEAEKAGPDAVTDIYIVNCEYVVPCSNLVLYTPPEVPEHYIRYREITIEETEQEESSVSGLLAAMDDTGTGDFYPTPAPVAAHMLDIRDWTSDDLWRKAWKPLRQARVKTILEPSAGRGDLADAIAERYDGRYRVHIDCIELNPDLRAVLKGKGYRVVHDNFLTFNTEFMYDLIVMNPPFSEAVKHVRKAMQMQARNGGMLIALVNAETIRNPYSMERKQLLDDLTENDAEITFVKNGFLHAARQTDVETAIIKVKMAEPKLHESDIFERLTKEQSFDTSFEDEEETQSMLPWDFIERQVQNYNVEIKAGLEIYKIYSELRPHILQTFDKEETSAMLTLNPGDANEYIRNVRNKYWRAALKNPEFFGRLTSNLQQDWMRRLDSLVEYDFTAFNIKAVFREMMSQVSQGVEDSILSYFDEFVRYAMYDGSSNVHYYNGWKTNSAYKVNKKIILPCYGVVHDKKTESYRIDSYGLLNVRRAVEELQDVEKVFNYLDDGTTVDCDLLHMLELASKGHKTRGIQTKYFEVTFFKKGTMHITFRDQKLLDAFNIYGARKRNWLPESYGHKSYEDMTDEEKAVIDDFQGKEEYEKVLADKQFYLQEPAQKQLMLTA